MSKKPTPKEPEYLRRVIEKSIAAGIKPGVHHVIVEHEQDCLMLNGGSKCNCKPDITLCEGTA